ncbi:hypothetical protein RB195_025017 [Necator americanus]|uniref:Uncharacterized protein n=1 Tax=Necator americanus TaxID=51031 RepID=A0ABR1EQI7_NECAM
MDRRQSSIYTSASTSAQRREQLLVGSHRQPSMPNHCHVERLLVEPLNSYVKPPSCRAAAVMSYHWNPCRAAVVYVELLPVAVSSYSTSFHMVNHLRRTSQYNVMLCVVYDVIRQDVCQRAYTWRPVGQS